MWFQWAKTLKFGICTCFVLYIFTTLDVLKKRPHEHDIKVDVNTIRTLVGYSLEHQIAEDLKKIYRCSFDKKRVENSTIVHQDDVVNLVYVLDADIHVLNVYEDVRLHPYTYIRSVALVPTNASIYCQIWDDQDQVEIHKATITEIWANEWRKQDFGSRIPSLLSCLKSKPLRKTSMVSYALKPCTKPSLYFPIKHSKKLIRKQDPKIKSIVCVKPIKFKKDITKLINEWIKINLKLGADKIIIYYDKLSKPTIKNLQLVVNEKLVQFFEFNFPSNLNMSKNFNEQIWFKRKIEILIYNDCFYNNLFKANFILPLDIDEIIVPKKGSNWTEMFQIFFNYKVNPNWKTKLKTFSSFSVKNAYFFKKYPSKAMLKAYRVLPKNIYNLTNLVNDQSSDMFDRKFRSLHYSPNIESAKSFISVESSLTVFNHFTFHELKPGLRQILLPTDLVQLNHYRDLCDPRFIENCHLFLNYVSYDNSLERFQNCNTYT